MSNKRTIMYVDETMYTPNGYIPSAVTEDEAGHSPMMGQGELAQPWYWGTDLDKAKELAAQYNAERGISPAEAEGILISSMVASNRAQAADERYAALKQGRA